MEFQKLFDNPYELERLIRRVYEMDLESLQKLNTSEPLRLARVQLNRARGIGAVTMHSFVERFRALDNLRNERIRELDKSPQYKLDKHGMLYRVGTAKNEELESAVERQFLNYERKKDEKIEFPEFDIEYFKQINDI